MFVGQHVIVTGSAAWMQRAFDRDADALSGQDVPSDEDPWNTQASIGGIHRVNALRDARAIQPHICQQATIHRGDERHFVVRMCAHDVLPLAIDRQPVFRVTQQRVLLVRVLGCHGDNGAFLEQQIAGQFFEAIADQQIVERHTRSLGQAL